MPQVGAKKFAYTPTGEKAASKFAAKTGKPLKMKPPKAKKPPKSPMGY